MSEPREGWVDVAGASIHYKVGGHGPVLLLLPDADGDADACDALAAEMGGYTTVSCDRRGQARSPILDPAQPVTIETHADDLARVLVAVTTHEAHVFGAGLGAVVGLDLAARHPHRVATLVAFEPAETSYELDLVALRAAHVRLVPAAGRGSRHHWMHHAATALARQIAAPLVEFEGDHQAFRTQPRAFAAQLHRLLDTPGLVATP
jgi:pimeloyl-ACP methyl ester carboxylesterase